MENKIIDKLVEENEKSQEELAVERNKAEIRRLKRNNPDWKRQLIDAGIKGARALGSRRRPADDESMQTAHAEGLQGDLRRLNDPTRWH